MLEVLFPLILPYSMLLSYLEFVNCIDSSSTNDAFNALEGTEEIYANYDCIYLQRLRFILIYAYSGFKNLNPHNKNYGC